MGSIKFKQQQKNERKVILQRFIHKKIEIENGYHSALSIYFFAPYVHFCDIIYRKTLCTSVSYKITLVWVKYNKIIYKSHSCNAHFSSFFSFLSVCICVSLTFILIRTRIHSKYVSMLLAHMSGQHLLNIMKKLK